MRANLIASVNSQPVENTKKRTTREFRIHEDPPVANFSFNLSWFLP